MVEELFHKLKNDLNLRLHFLEDKPEESVDSTLKACWFAASGSPKSAEEALKFPLPELTESQIERLRLLIDKRLENIPLAHITGRQNFMGIELLADKRALIPRKETEILGNKALEISKHLAKEKKPVRVMDICCGAGNLGLAVAHYNQDVKILATDLSHEAIELTKDNISFLGLNNRVHAEQGDLFSAFDKKEYYGNIDLIICNPPYISSAKVSKMNTEISDHEPVLAFDGGMFGTKIIQRLIIEASGFLTPAGWLIFEVGVGQGEFLMRLCGESEHYRNVDSVSDAHSHIRVIAAQRKMSDNF
ncbi:MAG TPA: peptide chain release factor N(5)-glutamine methyltransferase [Hanamia sp.]|nr:peptide chain release factor N(5)-glutamine methyltransferase [Hanamia sp.]